MDPEPLLEDVRRLAGLDSEAAAARAVIATLETLGQHVSAGETEDLAAGLPDEFGSAVTDLADETPEAFTPDEFVDRVAHAEREDPVDREEATRHVRAVMAALADAGLDRELQDAREQLPNEYATLFEREGLSAGSD